MAATPTPGLLGRDGDLEAIDAFLAGAGPGWAVSLEGEPGIGKTALWRAVLDRLERLGDRRILAARPSEAERRYAFAALTDLLAGVGDDVLARLPDVQRTAVTAATLRSAGSQGAAESRAVAAGLTTVLRLLAADGPLVVAVDDAQWLDDASRSALEFAIRRVDTGVLTTVRTGSGAGLPVGFTHVVGPLPPPAIRAVVRTALGTAPRRPGLARIEALAGGNPLLAVELARAERAGAGIGTGTLGSLVAARVAALSPAARWTVLVASLAGRPTTGMLATAGAAGGLDEAEEAQVLALQPDRVTFAHPLLAAAAVEGAAPPRRRAAHRALAGAVGDEERRARHLALAAVEPSAEVATALDRAVRATRGRGAIAEATELARLAVERSEDDPARLRERLVTLAWLVFEDGDAEQSEVLYRRALDACDDPSARAGIVIDLVQVLWENGHEEEAAQQCRRTLELPLDPAPAAELHLSLAAMDLDGARHAAAAAACLARLPEPPARLLAWALLQDASARFEAGEDLDVAALDRALALERQDRSWSASDQVANTRAVLLKFADRLPEARGALEELRLRAEQSGNFGRLPYVVGHLPVLLARLGDLRAAAAAARDHLELAETTGQHSQLWQAQLNLGLVALQGGDTAAAFEHAGRMAATLSEAPSVGGTRSHAGLTGAAHLVAGDPEAAVAGLDAWWAAEQGLGTPVGVSRFHGSYAEALVATGRTADCAAFLDLVHAAATAAGRPSVLADVARGRALLHAAAGATVAALDEADHALGLLSPLPLPFARAGVLLLKGRLHRRNKDKRLARDVLTEALRLYEDAGAPLLADRVRDELRRVNIRPAAPQELTPTELRVAELAASGLTNREIAGAAFISSKTVEANLSRAYRKLGITSRAELGLRLAGVPQQHRRP